MSELTLAGLDERIGQELGISDWVAIDQARIDTFASCTGDRQWIHVDVERAKRESLFRGPNAGGILTEGTREMNTLIVGKVSAGLSAFV